MGASDKLDAVVTELYGVDPGEFVTTREEHAARARERGEKNLAAEIRKLRKPTTAAALVNRLARQHPDEVSALAELGDRLRAAHRELAGDRLRELTRERADRVRALVERAETPASGALGESVRREVAATLEAAVGDADAARAVADGCLTSALSPSDVFEAAWLPVESPLPRSRPKRTKPTPKSSPDTRDTAERPAAREPDRDRTTPTKTRQDDDRAAAERQRREAEVRARRARDEARKELRAAEREETKARRRTERARAALEKAEDEVRRHAR
ncbi:hypothetical protein ACWGPQ_15065 [Saccharomonospora azurea]